MPGIVLSPHTYRPGTGVLGPGQPPPPAALMPGPAHARVTGVWEGARAPHTSRAGTGVLGPGQPPPPAALMPGPAHAHTDACAHATQVWEGACAQHRCVWVHMLPMLHTRG